MDPQPSAIILIWAVRIPFGELRCLTWQVGSDWHVGIYHDQAPYAEILVPNVKAVCWWATAVRREIDRIGLGGRPGALPDMPGFDLDKPGFDPDKHGTIDRADAFDETVAECVTCTHARLRQH